MYKRKEERVLKNSESEFMHLTDGRNVSKFRPIMFISLLLRTHIDKLEAWAVLTRSNWLLCFDISSALWCLAAAYAAISSAYLCPWVLSLVAPLAKRLHWCALNKPLRCHSTRDSQKIYVTFMTFTFRKGYRGQGVLWQQRQLYPFV